MHSINCNDLSDLEAEDLIREVWLLLEKHRIATPKLTVSRRANRLQIAFTFGSEADRAMVAHGLGADWAPQSLGKGLRIGRITLVLWAFIPPFWIV
jgi:DNA-binding transcriptional LysR family regulator